MNERQTGVAMGWRVGALSLLLVVLTSCGRLPTAVPVNASDISGPDQWKAFVLAVQRLLTDRTDTYYLADDVLYSDDIFRLPRGAMIFDPSFEVGVEGTHGVSVQAGLPEGFSITVILCPRDVWDGHRQVFHEFGEPESWPSGQIDQLLRGGLVSVAVTSGPSSLVLIQSELGPQADVTVPRDVLKACQVLMPEQGTDGARP